MIVYVLVRNNGGSMTNLGVYKNEEMALSDIEEFGGNRDGLTYVVEIHEVDENVPTYEKKYKRIVYHDRQIKRRIYAFLN